MSSSAPTTSIFIGNIPTTCGESDIYSILDQANLQIQPSSAKIRTSKRPKTLGSTGRFIVLPMENEEQANAVLEHLSSITFRIDGKQHVFNVSKFLPGFRQRFESGIGNIIIKKLPSDITQGALKEAYSSFGKVLSSRVVSYPVTNGKESEFTIGYVMFESDEEAERAIAGTNGKYLGQRQVIVEKYRSIKERLDNNTVVYFQNLQPGTELEDLLKLVGEAGIDGLDEDNSPPSFGEDKRPGSADSAEKKRWAVVTFRTHEDAEKAVNWFKEHEKDSADSVESYFFLTRGLKNYLKTVRQQENNQTFVESGRNLKITGIPPTTTETELRKKLSEIGSIVSISLPHGDSVDPNRFHANVLFETVDLANRCKDAIANIFPGAQAVPYTKETVGSKSMKAMPVDYGTTVPM